MQEISFFLPAVYTTRASVVGHIPGAPVHRGSLALGPPYPTACCSLSHARSTLQTWLLTLPFCMIEPNLGSGLSHLQEGLCSSVFSPALVLEEVTLVTDPVSGAAPWNELNEQQEQFLDFTNATIIMT